MVVMAETAHTLRFASDADADAYLKGEPVLDKCACTPRLEFDTCFTCNNTRDAAVAALRRASWEPVGNENPAEIPDYELPVSAGKMARWMQVTPRTVANWVGDGHLAGVKLPGGSWRVSASEARRYLTLLDITIPAALRLPDSDCTAVAAPAQRPDSVGTNSEHADHISEG